MHIVILADAAYSIQPWLMKLYIGHWTAVGSIIRTV